MDKIKTNDIYLKDIYLSEGGGGKCFITLDGKTVYKQFLKPRSKCFDSKKDSDIFVFPKVLVYDYDNKLTGYLMDYVDGKPFYKISDDFNIEVLLSNIRNIEHEILDKSVDYMYMVDLHLGNIMIDQNNRLKIIDTDGYYYKPSMCASNIYEYNMSLLSSSIINGVLFDICDDVNKKFKNKLLNKEKLDCYFGINKPSLFLENVLIELSDNCDENISDISTVRKNLNKILKRTK